MSVVDHVSRVLQRPRAQNRPAARQRTRGAVTVRPNLLDSAWAYSVRTVGVLGLIAFLWAGAVASERLHMALRR